MKPSMVNATTTSVLALLLLGIVLFVTTTNAAPQHIPKYFYPGYSSPYSPYSYEPQSIEYLLRAVSQMRDGYYNDNSDLENTKRGLDLGLSRGFSGSQAAKHLMGLAAANFAGGPGRKRRSNDEEA